MLASISPLGERARGNRWGRTAAAFAVGAAASGAALGAVLGVAGGAGGDGVWRTALVALAAVAAGAVDLFAPHRLPTPRRQVNEDWLARYRGWVYGGGFGAQLGVGVVTVVTTATVYAWMVAAAASGSARAGALIGACFGAGRAIPLLAVARADTPSRLRGTVRRLSGWGRASGRLAAAASVAVGIGASAAWLRA